MVVDVTAVTRPGVYVLRAGLRVVWIGRAKSPAHRLYAHLTHRRGGVPFPTLPREPVRFDGVEIIPCLVDDLETKYAETCTQLGWNPP